VASAGRRTHPTNTRREGETEIRSSYVLTVFVALFLIFNTVLAGPAARIEHRSGESAFGCDTHDCWLRLADIPRGRPSWYDASQGSPVIRS
jgi:hypothetical protein